MFSKNMDAWNIVFYNEVSLLNKLCYFEIEVYDFKKIGKYKYYFETYRKNRKKIKNNFNDCKIISRKGILNYIEAMFTKTTIFCVVASCFVIFNVSSRIWKVEISGDYKKIESAINDELKKNNIYAKEFYPSNNRLKEIESNISLYLSKEIEWIELKRRGSIISVRYQKRREANELPIKGGNLYATKDGMIRYFKVGSGVKFVKEYDYVRKGDLLVSDVIESSSKELIDIGTLGSVFANTFYIVNVEYERSGEDDASVFSNMLDKAKLKISSYLSKDEIIEIERVIDYKIEEDTGIMKVYYMLLEDITIKP